MIIHIISDEPENSSNKVIESMDRLRRELLALARLTDKAVKKRINARPMHWFATIEINSAGIVSLSGIVTNTFICEISKDARGLWHINKNICISDGTAVEAIKKATTTTSESKPQDQRKNRDRVNHPNYQNGQGIKTSRAVR